MCYISGLFQRRCASSALLVVPVSLLAQWQAEFAAHAPTVRVSVFHGARTKKRDAALYDVQRSGGVLLTTYGLAKVRGLCALVRGRACDLTVCVYE